MIKTSTIFSLSILLLRKSLAQPLLLSVAEENNEGEINYESPAFYERLVIIATLVLLGGVFAGT